MRVVLLGPPGAGKSTQARVLEAIYGVVHVASGDMLRAEIAVGSPLGAEAAAYMDAGELVPDDILHRMLSRRLAAPGCAAGFILDGFPRTLGQAMVLDGLLDDAGLRLDAVIEMRVSAKALNARIAGRLSCPRCAAVFNVSVLPPLRPGLCDACGCPLTRRADDAGEAALMRLNAYNRQTAPLLPYYAEQYRLFMVDGLAPPDEVLAELRHILEARCGASPLDARRPADGVFNG